MTHSIEAFVSFSKTGILIVGLSSLYLHDFQAEMG
jgi:hypothetical protein